MQTIIKQNNLTWINLDSPSAKEICDIAENYPLHPLVAEELITLTMRSKVAVYPENLYFVLHFPVKRGGANAEIDFVIGRDFLITTTYGVFPPLEKLMKNENFKDAPISLLLSILKELYGSSLELLDQIHIKTGKVEQKLFSADEKESLKEIVLLKRDILDFQKAFYLHGDILSSLEKISKEKNHRDFFDKNFANRLSVLTGEYSQIKNLIENSKETIDTLHAANESLLTSKTNEVMKVLTIMAFITFPLMLLSSVFGMNTAYTPILGMKGDFWVIMLAMLAATSGMFLYFKRKKWL